MSSRKYDIRKDHLVVRFNPGELRYMAYLPDGGLVTELSDASLRVLGKKNKEILTNPILYYEAVIGSINDERREKLRDLGFPCESFETLGTNRKVEAIDPEVLQYLRELTSESNTLIGIHRTGDCSLDQIADILRYGLYITPLNVSTTDSPIHLKNNVSYYSTNETIIKELMCADRLYKNSLGAILIRIPDENLACSNLYMIDSEEGTFILDPQYIIGFVPVGPNGKIDTIICNQVNPSKPFKGLDSLYEERTYAVDVDNVVSTGSKK